MMKNTICRCALLAALAIVAGGCSKTGDPVAASAAPQAANSKEALPPPALAMQPLPPPDVPKGAETPTPKPGQANDHSSPAFKAGGATAPQK